MSTLITKSDIFVVAPSEPTPAGTVHLTNTDCAVASFRMTALLIFEHPLDQPAEIIRRALARALVAYYPVAGRLKVGEQGAMNIACTGEGVAFVRASARCALRDAALTDRHPAVTVEELTVGQDYSSADMDRRALMQVQVTEFTCGGFAVAVTWDHVIADGVGIAQFLQAVGDFARGHTSPGVNPVRVDAHLPELPLPIISMARSVFASPHNDFPCTYISIPTSFIDRIKAEFLGRMEAACTTFDVFVATIWKCRARATIVVGDDLDAPMALMFTANVRGVAGATDKYYGNLFGFGLTVATRGEVADGDVLSLVRLVREAKEVVRYTFTDGYKEIAEEMVPLLRDVHAYDTVFVTSWWNLGLDDVNFGSGGAVRVMGNMETKVAPTFILCGRNDRADGMSAMALCVREEHQEAFHAELARLVGCQEEASK